MKNSYTLLLLLGSTLAYRPPQGSNPWHKNNQDIQNDKTDSPFPVDYFVPNLGLDEDIARVQKLMEAAPGSDDWKFVPKKLRPKDHPTDYVVPNFGVD